MMPPPGYGAKTVHFQLWAHTDVCRSSRKSVTCHELGDKKVCYSLGLSLRGHVRHYQDYEYSKVLQGNATRWIILQAFTPAEAYSWHTCRVLAPGAGRAQAINTRIAASNSGGQLTCAVSKWLMPSSRDLWRGTGARK